MDTLHKLLKLIEPRHQRKGVALLVLMLISMMLEMLGVGLVIPALGVMTAENLGVQYPALLPTLEWLGNPTRPQLVVGGVVALVGVYLGKNLFLAFLYWWQYEFIYELHARLSERLFANYLRQPYAFHLQHNSAQLIRNVVNEVVQFSAVARSTMQLATEIMVLVGIAALLFVIEPWNAMVIGGVLGIASWLFYRIIRARLMKLGEARHYHDGFRIQYVQEGLGAVKDIKVLGRENAFLTQFCEHNNGSATVLQQQYFLQQLPRLWLELLAVGGLVVMVVVMIWQGKPLEIVLPTLGLFGAAAFRLMPSVNRCVSAVQNARFAAPVVDTLYHELVELGERPMTVSIDPLPFTDSVTLDSVTFHYPGTKKPALDGVTLTIKRGSSIGFIGGSGAGKSTLVDVILGLLAPSHGIVSVDGIDIQSRLRSWQDLIGYVPQSIFLTDDTLRRNIAFGLADADIDDLAVARALRAARLDAFVGTLPEGLGTVVGERGVRLSGGQRQRIGIARALYHDPSVLVLDEATSSLDTDTETGVMEAVKAMQGEKTILVIAHRLSTVAHCDRLIRVENGRLVQESVSIDALGHRREIDALGSRE